MTGTKPNSAGEQQPVDNKSRYAKMSTSELKRRQTIDLSNEPVPRSLSAKAKNYDIRMPDGRIAHLAEGTHITDKQIFAGVGTKTPIHDEARLIKQYGGQAGKWVKVKAKAIIEHDGKTDNVEVHWYEEPSVGKVDMKVKRYL